MKDLFKKNNCNKVIETKNLSKEYFLNNINSFNDKRKLINSNQNSTNPNYDKILKSNQIDKKSLNNFLIKNSNKEIGTKFNNPGKNLIIQEKNYKEKEEFTKPNDNQKYLTSLNICDNKFKEVNNIYDFNKNLKLIQILKNENGILNEKLQEFLNKEKIIMNLNSKDYFSDIISFICNKLKIKNLNKEETIYTNLKKKRYRKNKDEINILEKFFSDNTFRWDNEIVEKLSNQLYLSKYTIYKWNWDKLKKYKINN